MSMLAERKTKQKWSLNPRGKDWSDDSNKFGQKMLEKMGWSKGKGLGANENGITEHLKISYKNDSKGMGFKDRTDQWTEHNSNFNALLESLKENSIIKNEENEEIKVASLEKKSQNSKVRVHYQKFTRGKDLSRYSHKDLANIFGKKSLSVVKEENCNEKIEEKEERNKFMLNGGSMFDYFKKKLPNFNKNTYEVGTNGVLKKLKINEEDDLENRIGFGFQPKNNNEISDFMSHSNEDTSKKVKKRKSKEIEEMMPNKKLKTESSGMANPAFDPLYSKVEMKKHHLHTIEECCDEENEEIYNETNENLSFDLNLSENCETKGKTDVKEKKKKMKKWKNNENLAENSLNNIVFENSLGSSEFDSFDCKQVKKKLKIEENFEIDNPNFNENINSLVVIDNSCNFEVKRKKKKLKKNANNTINNLSNDAENSVTENNNSSHSEVKLKRKKVKNEEHVSIDNLGFNENITDKSDINNLCVFEVARREKKVKNEEQFALDNPNFDEIEKITSDNSISSKFEVKRKQKKVKNEEKFALDDPNFTNKIADTSEINIINNFEVKRKTKKMKNEEQFAFDNRNFNEIDKITSDNDISSKFEVKRKKKKVKNEKEFALDNPNFNEIEENTSEGDALNKFEGKRKKKKVKNEENFARNNPNFNEIEECVLKEIDSSKFEVTRKKKKVKSEENFALDNPNFVEIEEITLGNGVSSKFEVKRKKKKVKNEDGFALDNPNFNEIKESASEGNDSNKFEVTRKKKKIKIEDNISIGKSSLNEASALNETEKNSEESFEDLILNVTTTPISSLVKTKKSEKKLVKKRRKSVRFSNINEERIIPNNGNEDDDDEEEEVMTEEDLRKRNELFEINERVCIDSLKKIEDFSLKIDKIEAQIENDINEEKQLLMIGEVSSSSTNKENEKLPNGTKLKLKNTTIFERATPSWLNFHNNNNGNFAKKSYKHLIKGDIIVQFKNTNLHEIVGYATRKT